jgi:hypothetical protein
MALKTSEIPLLIVERVEASHPAPALFTQYEIDDWPDGVLKALIRCGVLVPAERAETRLCPGCELQCVKPVVVRAVPKLAERRAFILCDEDPALGRIRVNLTGLSQFKTSLALLSRFLATNQKWSTPRSSANGAVFALGQAKGRFGSRQLSIQLDGERLCLKVGDQLCHLATVLRWADDALAVDQAHIMRLLNRKGVTAHGVSHHIADRTAQTAKRKSTASRDREIYKLATKLKRTPGVNTTMAAEQIAKRLIANSPTGSRLSPNRIRRIITEQAKLERENRAQNTKKTER